MNAAVRAGTRGSITPFAVIVLAGLFLVGGLVHDGGLLLAERRDAASTASAAARYAAQSVDVAAARGGTVRLDPALASQRVQQYLATVGATGRVVSVDDATVVVEVTDTVDFHFLDVVGLSSRDVTATGRARITRGITEADQ